MPIEIRPLQYAHSDGHTDVSYYGEKIISCGADGDVRIWDGYEDDDPMQTCLGEFALCARSKNDNLLVGTDNNSVQMLSLPSGERDGIFTRFTSHVNHIAIGKNHTCIALGSEDMTIKLLDLISKETKMSVNVEGTPLSLAICPKAQYLAAACGDGKLLIYNIDNQSILKEINVVPKTNSFLNAKLLCRIDFDQNNNKYFAYPEDNNIVVLKVSDWSEYCRLSTAVTAAFSIVSISTCGNNIAAASLEGDIVVFCILTQTLIGYKKHPKGVAITSLAWNPKENGDLAFGDAQGYVGLAINCSMYEKPREVVKACSSTSYKENDVNDVALEASGSEIDFGDVQFEDDDDDNENAISLKKLKEDVLGTDHEHSEDKASTCPPSPDFNSRPRTPEIPLQSPFMPSSTPEHLDPRYLCWNEVGVIRCYGSSLEEDDEGARSIEVEFHDSTVHNSMMLNNYQGYFMGSISSAALAVATSNVVKIVPLGGASKEWQFNVLEPDEIVLIAASHNIVCCVTMSYQLHVFSIYGTQRAVVAIPGPAISISAFGHVVMVAYHMGPFRKSDQCVNIMLLKFEGHSVENRNIYGAMGPETTLQWLGFSDVGTPALMDSNGMIYLHPLQSNVWLPFCDTTRQRNSPMDGFFLTAIYESFCTARGIKCKGTMYPGFTPRPTVCEIELQAPYLELGTEKAQLESNLFTWSNLQVKDFDKKYKEAALKTFALATKNNLDERALELVEMFEFKQILSVAIKYASKLNKNRLVDKLLEISSKVDDDDLDDSINNTSISTPTNVIRPNRTITLSSARSRLKGQTSNRSSLTPSANDLEISQNSECTPTSSKNISSISTQGSLVLGKEKKNPFLKSLRKPQPPQSSGLNPFSLTDKFEGSESKDKENKKEQISAEKRKKPDTSPMENKIDKQRRLDKYMFKKKT